jgi:hypothetical protein
LLQQKFPNTLEAVPQSCLGAILMPQVLQRQHEEAWHLHDQFDASAEDVNGLQVDFPAIESPLPPLPSAYLHRKEKPASSRNFQHEIPLHYSPIQVPSVLLSQRR